MERLIVADGGGVVKRGWLLLGWVIAGGSTWSAPLLAQAASDPLAPLPVPSQPYPAPTQPASPAVAQPDSTLVAQPSSVVAEAAPVPRTVAIPKDWRGVFDAIDAGNWASAQAGIA